MAKTQEPKQEPKPRKTRKKDDTLALFPELYRMIESQKRVVKALKACRKIMSGADGTWLAKETAMLIRALQEQVQPSQSMAYESVAGSPTDTK